MDCSPQQFHDQLIVVFPKLASCGGFELLRCVANSKALEPIAPSVTTSPVLLKRVVGKSRVYIRPIQRDLGLEAASGEGSTCMQVCF